MWVAIVRRSAHAFREVPGMMMLALMLSGREHGHVLAVGTRDQGQQLHLFGLLT